MNVQSLLTELSGLPHSARIKRMVEVGKRSKSDTESVALIRTLESMDVYERYLALQSCFGSLDGAHVLSAITDQSRLIRGLAINLVALACNDVQAEQALMRVTPKTRRVLAAKLLKAKRQVPVDNFIERAASQGDKQINKLLPLGSPALLTRYLNAAIENAGQHEWRRFARRYPLEALAILQQRADAAQELNRRLLWLANAVIPITARHSAQETLPLVHALARLMPLRWIALQPLVQRIPAQMADLALSVPDKLNLVFDSVVHKLDTDRVVALIERGYIAWHDARLFKKLTPELRSHLYHVFQQGWRDKDGVMDHGIIGLLPAALREQEARYQLQLPALATRPKNRLSYVAFLPWEEVFAEVDRFIRNPDPELRSAAWSALIQSVRYQRSRLSALLPMIHAHRNEQDPIRFTIISTLASLPPSVWNSNHLNDLSQIIRDTLDAADLSVATASYAERLLIALLPIYPEWVAQWLPIFVKERGRIFFHDLSSRVSDADVQRIAPTLLPVLDAWAVREREAHLIAFAQSLQRRLRVFDGLIQILERLVRNTVTARVANSALALILEHAPHRASQMIPDLIDQDNSWVTQQPVYNYLHCYRQDLLTPFLAPTAPYRGRFSSGNTKFVLPFSDGFERWTPEQQALFATTLRNVTGDEMRDMPAILVTIHQYKGLMFIPPARLISLAHVETKRLITRDAALRALGQLDAGQGIPVLIEAMSDDRARIAIYALRSALLEMPSAQALEILRSIPMEKVTVAKEVIRLIGELKTDEALATLLEFNQQPLHRDVRVALLRGLWDYLDHNAVWDILNAAAVDSDPAIAKAVGRIPANTLSLEGQTRLVALLVRLMGHPESEVRIDAFRRCKELPVADTSHALMNPLLEAVSSPFRDESEAAAAAIFATYAGRNATVIAEGVSNLILNRRVLYTLLKALQVAVQADRGHLIPTVRAVIEILKTDPITSTIQVELAVNTFSWAEVADNVLEIAKAQEFHADALAAAIQQLHAVYQNSIYGHWGQIFPEYASTRSDKVEVIELEKRLRGHADANVRRLALAALIVASEAPFGWDEERTTLLEAYRADPAPMVAAAAQFTFPPQVTQNRDQ